VQKLYLVSVHRCIYDDTSTAIRRRTRYGRSREHRRLRGPAAAGSSDEDDDRPAVAGETLTLTTTTSTYDTGLLDAIHADFEKLYGVSVDAVAQGNGARPYSRLATATPTW